MEYEAVIGLETHVQLKTQTKLWCGCPNRFGDPPNTNVCPICLGMPGVLPVPNEQAIRLAILAGLLLKCKIPRRAKFDRKNYFYPDMPKNYQISQYDEPFAVNGYVEFEFDDKVWKVGIARAHLEEDVAKSLHFADKTAIDFNRAGVPLLEIVSEPQITSPEMAYAYLVSLKEILSQGGISDCDMEKGMVRCDVNVSVRPKGSKELGVKIEIKNLNSFSAVRRALEYEIARQIQVLNSGGVLTQSTRRWDEALGITEEMRTKEYAHDYRYFPDPDLVPFEISENWLAEIKKQVIELPLDRQRRLMAQYGLCPYDARVLAWNRELAEYFEIVGSKVSNQKALANLLINNLQGLLTELNQQRKQAYIATYGTHVGFKPISLYELPFSPDKFAKLVQLVENGELSISAAQQVLEEMFQTGTDPFVIVEQRGLRQVSDTKLIEEICVRVIEQNPGPVKDFINGKESALNFLVGQVMRLSKGKANPRVAYELLRKKIKTLG